MTPTKPTLWTATQIAKATNGRTTGTWKATGLATDSRLILPGDVFVAIRSADFPSLYAPPSDGHKYITAAFEKGAVGAIVQDVPAGFENDPRLVIVASTHDALIDLAHIMRAQSGAKFIGVTGSVGKTSTRDMLTLCFGPFGMVHAPIKNYNNELGVPLTLAQIPDNADYSVIEMGMNHAGEITPLSRMTKPDIAIITSITPAHIENFENGLDGIADAKTEIFAGVETTGTVILPRDCAPFARVMAAARTAGIQHILSFGEHAEADARMITCIEARNGTRISAVIMGESVDYFIPAGKHQAINALAALLAVKVAGLNVQQAAIKLAQFAPIEGRGREEKLNIGEADNPVILLDESYNASPAAMQAAFRVMALIDPGRGGRRIAILGDMLELGHEGPKLHADLALPLRAANVDLVYTCGTLMKNLQEALPANTRGLHKDTSAELAQIVPDVLVPGDVVMVKGSHGSRMDLVVEALRALPARKGVIDQDKGQNRHAL